MNDLQKKEYTLSKMADIEALIGDSVNMYMSGIRDYVNDRSTLTNSNIESIAGFLRDKVKKYCKVLHYELLFVELISDLRRVYDT